MTQKEFFQNNTPLGKTLAVLIGTRVPLMIPVKIYKKKHHLDTAPISMALAVTTIRNILLSGWFLYEMSQSDVDWKKDWETFKNDPDYLEELIQVAGIESVITAGTTSLMALLGYHMPSEKGHKWLKKLGLTRENLTGQQQFPVKTGKDYALLLLASVIAPFREEMTFRGALNFGLEDLLGEEEGAALSSLLFGAAHGPKAFGATAAMAIMATVMDARHEDNIFYSMVWHEANNSLAALAALTNYFDQKKEDEGKEKTKPDLTEKQMKIIYRVIGPFATVFGLYLLNEWLKDHQN